MIDPQNPDYSNTPVCSRRPKFHYRPVDPSAEPLVSIVTPFYNTREYLHDTAKCIFAQSLQRWEWILVNDRSTDAEALHVLDEYRHRDPRVRVIDHIENKGPGAARNTGYRAARASFVYQMDDDDLLEPTVIEKKLWFLHAHPEFAIVNGWSVAFGAKEYLWPTGFNRGDDLLKENLAVGRALVRKCAHDQAGGFDESIRGGMEDWDFWLRCANAGLWGATLPEYCDWYRRRTDHSDRWSDWSGPTGLRKFQNQLRAKYPRLYREGVPPIERVLADPCTPVPDDLPFANPLQKTKPRLLLIVPWLTMGGADKFNLDLIQQLTQRGWEVSIVTTNGCEHVWMPEFAKLTPDIFALHNFLKKPQYPVFLRYLIESRRPEVVLTTNSELGYLLLPFLRTYCPEPAYVDLCHSEAKDWKCGGYPRYAAAHQDLLDLSIVSTAYLKEFTAALGADPDRIEVIYTNTDVDHWSPNPVTRRKTRAAHRIPLDQTVILFSGRIHSDKQPQVLAGTFRELAARGLEFRAFATGDGPDLPWLQEYVDKHGLSRCVTVLGRVPSEDIRTLMMAADIFFLPSLWEGIAVTLYEAMACGVTVVGADVGGQRELVTPECGILLPKSTPEEETRRYADELAKLIVEPERRAALGTRARQRVCESFTLDKMGNRAVELLRRAQQLKTESSRPALPRRFALECATLGAEYMRMSDLLDYYWTHARNIDEALQNLTAERDRLLGAVYVRTRRFGGRVLRKLGLRK